MSEKTVLQQPSETNERICSIETKVTVCYVCNQPFNIGDKVYILKNNRYLGRHITCARTIAFVKKVPCTEEEHIEKRQNDKHFTGSGRRQRTGGHGYTGGTGFKDICLLITYLLISTEDRKYIFR